MYRIQSVQMLSVYFLYLLLILPNALGNSEYPHCADTTDLFNVTVMNITTVKDCDWVIIKPERCVYDDVPYFCPVTCDN